SAFCFSPQSFSKVSRGADRSRRRRKRLLNSSGAPSPLRGRITSPRAYLLRLQWVVGIPHSRRGHSALPISKDTKRRTNNKIFRMSTLKTFGLFGVLCASFLPT